MLASCGGGIVDDLYCLQDLKSEHTANGRCVQLADFQMCLVGCCLWQDSTLSVFAIKI